MNDSQPMETYVDPHRGVLCRRADHLISQQLDAIPACGRCGAALCMTCFREGVRLDSCPWGDTSCPNVRRS